MSVLATKRSRQRDRIYQVLRKTRSHPTAEWVFEQVRQQIPKISLGTVYRNLSILKQQGRVQALDLGGSSRRYDAFVDEHYHFVCNQCSKVLDLEVSPQVDLDDRVRAAVPGIVQFHRLDFFGTCTDCLQKQ